MTTDIEDRRAAAVRALVGPGDERMRLVNRLADLDAQLRPLVQEARAAGVTQARVVQLTGLAPNTVGKWAKG